LSSQNPGIIDQLVKQWRDYMSKVGGVEPLKPQGYY
jgi:arylsulfatase